MDKESLQSLRFDRRLANRKGHVDASELDAYLAELPDLSEKVAAEDEEVGGAAAAAPASAPAETAGEAAGGEAPAPVPTPSE